MQNYEPKNIRNIVLLSHGGAGKTSLSEALLLDAGAINRLGKVDEGTTTSDWDPDEQKRKISTGTSVLPLEWKGHKINVLDAPGYADFVGEMKAGASAADTAVIVISAPDGVEVGTELVWRYADEVDLPRIVFVNKMDRENADYFRSLDQVRATFGNHCVPYFIPIGAETGFKGVIDLVAQKAYFGVDCAEGEIPADLKEAVAEQRERLVEAVAESDDDLIAKYLEGEEIGEVELREALHKGIVARTVVPVLAGSSLQNVGIRCFLDSVVAIVPSPLERPAQQAQNASTGKEEDIVANPAGPLAAFVFKSTADPYVGKLTYFRVFSGTLKSDSHVWDAAKERDERVGQVLLIRGKSQEPVQQVVAGDIGAVAKLTDVSTGDTLTMKEHPLVVTPVEFPKPVFRTAVHPKTKSDLDKLGSSLSRLVEEDPTLHVYKDPDTSETILAGIGESHVDIAIEKMKRKFGAEVTIALPKVSYKETIHVEVSKAEFKHKKQTGGHGQYGHVVLKLEPLPRGTGSEFAEKVVGGSVPKNYIPAVEKGVHTALSEGILARFPVVDVRATLYDGSYHPVDSSDMSFQIASQQAFKHGMEQGQPVLLEPIMALHVTAPEGQTGDIISDMNTKRAKVLGMNPADGQTTIEALVPLAEVQRYATDLRSITQGRGSFTMELSHYEEVPAHLAQKVIDQAKKDREAAEKA